MKPKTKNLAKCDECGRQILCKWLLEYEKMGFSKNTVHSCPAFVDLK